MSSTIIARPALRAALATVCGVAEKRNTIPILANALLRANAEGGLSIIATDMDLMATVSLDATTDAGFAATIPAHALRDLEKKAPATGHVAIDALIEKTTRRATADERREAGVNPGDVFEVACEDCTAALDFEGLRMTIPGLPVADFPELRIEGEIKASFSIPSAALREAFEAVQFAISTEETRYYLNGIFMEARQGKLRFVATDGHRMAVHDVDIEGAGLDYGVIIPRKTVAFLLSIVKAKGAAESVDVLINTVKARFTVGHVDVITKLIDGTYPDYQRVMPARNPNLVIVNRKAFTEAVNAVSAMSSERGRAVKLTFSDLNGGNLHLIVTNPDLGKAEMSIPCDYSGPCLELGVNAAYLTTILKASDHETVAVALADPGSPILMADDHGSVATRYVQMPMRV
ncbi:DNA polymerase III subunit beta [Microvirga brassicacearum]|nr:DNA polymerase III subunit beta [Microvirga brassicacearum]